MKSARNLTKVDKQLEGEGLDWLACFVWGVLLAALILGSVFGHAVVSGTF